MIDPRGTGHKPCGRGPLAVLSSPRLDVLVEVEEVRQIILVLQRHQPLAVRPVDRFDPICALLAEVVDVDAPRYAQVLYALSILCIQ
jgi:hypothetical protein